MLRWLGSWMVFPLSATPAACTGCTTKPSALEGFFLQNFYFSPSATINQNNCTRSSHKRPRSWIMAMISR